MFASAELMLGANHIKIRCFDGVTRTGRIKGKIKKKVWIREGDVLVVVPWSFQDEKCDIVYRYTRPRGGVAPEEPVSLILSFIIVSFYTAETGRRAGGHPLLHECRTKKVRVS